MAKAVFITGASRGIGRACALHFAGCGYNLVISCERNVSKLNEVAAEAAAKGVSVLPLVFDVSDYAATKAAVEAATARVGQISVLINNAGVSHVGLFNEMRPEEWQRVIGVNIGGVLNLTRQVLPQMIAEKNGIIINMSSIWGRVGASCEAVYSMTKGAVNAFTRALAKECAPNAVRVNAIACGLIDTDMNGCFTDEEIADFTDKIPMGRAGTPQEVAEFALFLASDEAAYVTGQVITLDGGLT